jgi:hypothetical protein
MGVNKDDSPTFTGNMTILGTLGVDGNFGVGGDVGIAGNLAVGGNLAVTGFITSAIPKFTNSLGSDVLLNNTANYFDGPSVAQGTTGTWFASGSVTVQAAASNDGYYVKLWDGTTVISSIAIFANAVGAIGTASISGFITSPAANIRISVRDISSTTGKILFNATGTSKDSTISAYRIG